VTYATGFVPDGSHYDGVVGNTGDPGAVVDHVVAHALPVTVHVVGRAGVVVTG
jgi:hypothetical protein